MVCTRPFKILRNSPSPQERQHGSHQAVFQICHVPFKHYKQSQFSIQTCNNLKSCWIQWRSLHRSPTRFAGKSNLLQNGNVTCIGPSKLDETCSLCSKWHCGLAHGPSQSCRFQQIPQFLKIWTKIYNSPTLTYAIEGLCRRIKQ